MKSIPFVVFILLIVAGIFGFIILNNKPLSQISSSNNIVTSSIPSSTPTAEKEVSIKAKFTIKTDQITRNFNASKYHNQTPDVYITAEDSTIVNVKKAGITWQDFFDTLPMKLTKDCLITGDGEKLCSDSNSSLKFYLNDTEDKNLLEKEIKEDDHALIIYKSN